MNKERILLLLFTIAALGTLMGVTSAYWDIQWHILIGRDSFWILPHIPIYLGIGMVFVISAMALLLIRVDKTMKLRPYLLPFLIAFISSSAQLAGGRFDNWWHLKFGLDVTIWSPPHILLIAGGILSAFSYVIFISRYIKQNKHTIGNELLLELGAASTLLGLNLYLAEFEYFAILSSSHISQTRPGWLYACLLALSVLFIVVLVRKLGNGKLVATRTILLFIVIRFIGLALLDPNGIPFIPFTALTIGIIIDLLYNRKMARTLLSGAIATLLFLITFFIQSSLQDLTRFNFSILEAVITINLSFIVAWLASISADNIKL